MPNKLTMPLPDMDLAPVRPRTGWGLGFRAIYVSVLHFEFIQFLLDIL
jgi:hypothetical protein